MKVIFIILLVLKNHYLEAIKVNKIYRLIKYQKNNIKEKVLLNITFLLISLFSILNPILCLFNLLFKYSLSFQSYLTC